MTQGDIARIIGVDQPKVSAIVHGRLTGFSIERLTGMAEKLGYEARFALYEANGPMCGCLPARNADRFSDTKKPGNQS